MKKITALLVFLLVTFIETAQSKDANKTILITAATSYLGTAVCKELAATNHNLILTARSREKLKTLEKDLYNVNKNIKIKSFLVDFSAPSTIESLTEKLKEDFIDGIVLIGPRPKLISGQIQSKDEWENAFTNTFVAPLSILKSVESKINNNSSIVIISGLTSKNYMPQYPNTNVLRMAWVGHAKNLTHYFSKKRIRVNVISPGIIMTPHHKNRFEKKAKENNTTFEEQLEKESSHIPLNTFGDPLDVANLTLFLLSEKAKHINGVNIPLDGGESSAY